jgi:hypothetical protein
MYMLSGRPVQQPFTNGRQGGRSAREVGSDPGRTLEHRVGRCSAHRTCVQHSP